MAHTPNPHCGSMTDLQQYIEKATTLVEALPYIQSFRGKIIVVK